MNSRLLKPQGRRAGIGIRLAMALAVVLVIALGINFWLSDKVGASKVNTTQPVQIHRTEQPKPVSVMLPPPASDSSIAMNPVAEPVVPARTNTVPVRPGVDLSGFPHTQPTALTRQLVSSLTQLSVSEGGITPEQARVWQQNLELLLQQGEAAVPAIKEFLEKNLDLSFSDFENAELLNHSSLRSALLEVMLQIGGTEATGVALQTLQTTADPSEIAMLAQFLAQDQAGQYHDIILDAAREALSVAATREWDGRDVGALFDLLKSLGGPAAVTELERYAGTWFNYAPLALADLPDGEGIPALIRLALNTDNTLGRDLHFRMLAQVAPDSPDAFSALLQLARAGQVTASAWQGIAQALTGAELEIIQSPLSGSGGGAFTSQRSYHVVMGNQNFRELPPPQMSSELLQERIRLVDQLMPSAQNPTARASLQTARTKLESMLAAAG